MIMKANYSLQLILIKFDYPIIHTAATAKSIVKLLGLMLGYTVFCMVGNYEKSYIQQ